MQPGLGIEYVDATSLVPMEGNPRKNDVAIPKVVESIRRFGWTNPILAARASRIVVAGHTRLEAAKRMGLPQVPVIWLDMDPVTSRLYNLADNKLAQISEWDDTALVAMLEELRVEDAAGLAIAGFDEAEMNKLLDSVRGAADGLTDPDDVPVVRPTDIERGQVFALGEHRIICGDSTVAADVDAVMRGELADICWTDPPWNVAYGNSAHPSWKKRKAIANDDLGEGFPSFCAAFTAEMKRVMKVGAPLYLAMSAQEWGTIMGVLREFKFHWSSTIIWAKDSLVLSRKDYHTQYEPLWYGWSEGAARLVEVEDRKQSDLWEIKRPKKSEEHPTMKPVELIARALLNSSGRGGIVYEPFSGSGSTIVAAEQTGRRCRAIELDPSYVQVAIERWEKFAGKKAKRVT